MKLLTKLLMKGGAGVTPVLNASITTGVAPFGVVFDGVSTTAPGNAFHDYIYFFDFGDGTSANYTYGELAGTTKNEFLGGPVATHVYETDGSYTASMWVSDGVSVWGPATQTITVTAADTYYSLANTYYISADTLPVAGANGVPVGATNLFVQSNWNTIFSTYLLAGKRVLLKDGDTFTASTTTLRNALRNFYLGKYGSPVTGYAKIQATGNNVTLVYPFPNNTANYIDNVRITGIHFDRTVGSGFTGATALNISSGTDNDSDPRGNFTFHNIKMTGLSGQNIATSGVNVVLSKVLVEGVGDNTLQAGANAIYTSNCARVGVIDSSIDNNSGGEHCYRSQGSKMMAIVSNKFYRCASTKSLLTVRGFGSSAVMSNFVVNNNTFDGRNNSGMPWMTQQAPQNATSNEPQTDSIWENNFYIVSGNNTSGIQVSMTQLTARNNVFNTDASGVSAFCAVRIYYDNTAGLASPTDNKIYHNTAYHIPTLGFSFVETQASTVNTVASGNVAYAPASTATGNGSPSLPTFHIAAGGTYTITSDNSTDSQIKNINPVFIGTTAARADYRLQAGSPYKNVVTTNYKTRADGLGKLRVGATYDAGALNAPDKQVDAWTLIP